MRIVGGHDYYDSAQAFGQDAGLVFARKAYDRAEAVPYLKAGLAPQAAHRLCLAGGRNWLLSSRDQVDNRRGRYAFTPRVVWFAGVRRACVEIDGVDLSGRERVAVKTAVWSAAELAEFLDRVGSGFSDTFLGRDEIGQDNVAAFFSDRGSAAERDWLVANGISIAVSHDPCGNRNYGSWHENRSWKFDVDGLRQLGFARVLSPYDAFQELSMWVGGTLARPGAPTVEIASDTVRRDKHGFDGWSFKKRKVA